MRSIISASRRTDLPRWYLPKTIRSFMRGYINLMNPYSQKEYRVNLKPKDVHSIAWWSKDYSAWLQEQNAFKDYHNYFNFTLIGYRDSYIQKLLESGVTTSLDGRIAQVKALADAYSPDAVNWRFDPIIYFTAKGIGCNNIANLEYIASQISQYGIKRCTISFMIMYAKAMKRAEGILQYIDPPLVEKQKIAVDIAKTNAKYGIKTYACTAHALVDNHWIYPSKCIDGEFLGKLFNDPLINTEKDKGQREECGCTVSKDIGSYTQHCHHECIYCYSNPPKTE